MNLSPHGTDLMSCGDADPMVSASNSIKHTSSSDDLFESPHLQGADGMLFAGSENTCQYQKLPKLDGLDNLHSNLDTVAVDKGGLHYPKITFRQPQTSTSVPPAHSHSLGEPFSIRFKTPWSTSSTTKRARRKSSNHSGSPIEPYSASSSMTSSFILTPDSTLFSASPLSLSPLSSRSYDSSDSFKFKTPLTPADQDSGSEISPPLFPLQNKKVQRMTRDQRVSAALTFLRDGKLSPIDLLIAVLDPSDEKHQYYRQALYKADASKLHILLDHIIADPNGKHKMDEWMAPHAVDYACREVDAEMEAVKKKLSMSVSDVTPEFMTSWTVNGNNAFESMPVLSRILTCAAQSPRAAARNKLKSPATICSILVYQLSHSRSYRSIYFQTVFGFFLWSTGCARQTIDALHHCGLSVSFDSILLLIKQLASCAISRASQIAQGPHAHNFDNINLSTSIFVEQRSDAPSKVQSGTFVILYELLKAKPQDMVLAPILERAKTAGDLHFNTEIRPTITQLESFNHQLQVIVIRVLTAYCPAFERYASDPTLQHRPRRTLPAGYKTKQYPLRITTIDESTVSGTIDVINDTYMVQLGMAPEDLANMAIVSINDQLTNSNIRSTKLLRMKDTNTFTRIQNFQLGFGLFHLCMNLIWAMLHVHRGTVNQLGSLSYFFALMEKTRLGGEHPDYHTLLTAMMQTLNGLILAAWRLECGHSTLASFAASKPTPEHLLSTSKAILLKYATPMNEPEKPDKCHVSAEGDGDGDEDEDEEEEFDNDVAMSEDGSGADGNALDPYDDITHRNVCILMRDLLYVAELTRAISDGDWGRVEDIIANLAMMFRGAGSNNYCSEILHFIFNLKKVWGEDFGNVMRDNMIVNMVGLQGHAMGADENIEHGIRTVKTLFASKGLYGSWDRLGDASAAVNHVQDVKKRVGSALSTAYHGSTHSSPDTSNQVWCVADKVKHIGLQTFCPGRDGNEQVKPCVDILSEGEAKLKSASLKTFNRKIHRYLVGQSVEAEIDTLPPCGLQTDREADE